MREPAPAPYNPPDPSDPQRLRPVVPPRWPIAPAGEVLSYAPQQVGHTAPLPLAPSAMGVDRRRARRRRRSLAGDVAAGLFLGDFARELGVPGAITQVAISFVPLIGSMCAVRDLTADLRHHDRVGAALNALALTPILGGFSKTFEVIRSTAHVGHAVHISRQQAERRKNRAAE